MVCCQTIHVHEVDKRLGVVDMQLHNVTVAKMVGAVAVAAYPMEGIAMVVVERLATLVVEVLARIGLDGMTLATMDLHLSLSHVDANRAMSSIAPCQL